MNNFGGIKNEYVSIKKHSRYTFHYRRGLLDGMGIQDFAHTEKRDEILRYKKHFSSINGADND